jgi:hypothetical protein
VYDTAALCCCSVGYTARARGRSNRGAVHVHRLLHPRRSSDACDVCFFADDPDAGAAAGDGARLHGAGHGGVAVPDAAAAANDERAAVAAHADGVHGDIHRAPGGGGGGVPGARGRARLHLLPQDGQVQVRRHVPLQPPQGPPGRRGEGGDRERGAQQPRPAHPRGEFGATCCYNHPRDRQGAAERAGIAFVSPFAMRKHPAAGGSGS